MPWQRDDVYIIRHLDLLLVIPGLLLLVIPELVITGLLLLVIPGLLLLVITGLLLLSFDLNQHQPYASSS